MKALFETYTETYGKDVVSALREHFGDEKAIEKLSAIERDPFRSRVYTGMEESESETETETEKVNPFLKRVYPGMEKYKNETAETKSEESIGELTEESKQVLIESLTDSYGEKMVKAFREQFGDERAISMLLSMRDAVSYSRVYTGM